MRTNFDLVCEIQECFAEVPLTTVDLCFVTLQNMMKEVKNANGGNSFKTLQKRKYAPVKSDDKSFYDSDSETETEQEDKDKTPNAMEEDNIKPPLLQRPRLCKKMANMKITRTKGQV